MVRLKNLLSNARPIPWHYNSHSVKQSVPIYHVYTMICFVTFCFPQNERVGLEENKQKLLLEREREMALLRAQAEAKARADILAAKGNKIVSIKDLLQFLFHSF